MYTYIYNQIFIYTYNYNQRFVYKQIFNQYSYVNIHTYFSQIFSKENSCKMLTSSFLKKVNCTEKAIYISRMGMKSYPFSLILVIGYQKMNRRHQNTRK